ncbi:unnamed protein product [Arctogadus glacialis]
MVWRNTEDIILSKASPEMQRALRFPERAERGPGSACRCNQRGPGHERCMVCLGAGLLPWGASRLTPPSPRDTSLPGGARSSKGGETAPPAYHMTPAGRSAMAA